MIECECTHKEDLPKSTKFKLLKVTSNTPDPDLSFGVGMLILLLKTVLQKENLYLDQGKRGTPTESSHFSWFLKKQYDGRNNTYDFWKTQKRVTQTSGYDYFYVSSRNDVWSETLQRTEDGLSMDPKNCTREG